MKQIRNTNNSDITQLWNKSRIFRHFGPRVPLRQFYGHVTLNLFTMARYIDLFHYLTILGDRHLAYCCVLNPHEQSSAARIPFIWETVL